MKISVAIPIYNSKKIIEDTLNTLIRTLNSMSVDYEILFRDDASSDGSRKKLEEISLRHSRVRCFYNQRNQGLGFTLKQLFNDAQGEVIIYLDCDLPFGVDIFPLLLEEIQNHDIVVASRYAGSISRVPFLRKIASRMYYFLCKFLFSLSVRDVGSGTVALRKESLRLLELKAQRFGIHAEIFAKAQKLKLLVKELSAPYRPSRSSSFSIFRHGPGVIVDTIKLWWRLQG